MRTTATAPAAVAQRLRKAILTWHNVAAVHGPMMLKQGQLFLRIEFYDGSSFYIELGVES